MRHVAIVLGITFPTGTLPWRYEGQVDSCHAEGSSSRSRQTLDG